MSYKQLKKKQDGFTIIEVLIVLAIAGLILLIVFLAVPALQRNSRNTQAKSAAASVLSAVNEFSTNNNGTIPTVVSIATNGDISVGTATSTSILGKTQGGYLASVSTTAPATGETGIFAVAPNSKCNGSVLAGGTQNRAVAILYNIETTGSTTPQCTES